jgi:hypothetical protein
VVHNLQLFRFSKLEFDGMGIRVVAYEPRHEPLVEAFNSRLTSGGAGVRFYEKASPKWLPPGLSDHVRREFFVAVDDADAVRGAYVLKPQTFVLKGRSVVFASIQGPLSEGVVDHRYAPLALVMIRDMYSRCPLLFGWGGGERIHRVLRGMGWTAYKAPLLIHVRNPARFLRQAPPLRRRAAVRLTLDGLASSGGAWPALWMLRFAQRVRRSGLRIPECKAEAVRRFDLWADEIWRRACGASDVIARRDSETLNALVPETGFPEATIVKVSRGDEPVGWAVVRHRQLNGDPRFGSLRLGSIIDALAVPGFEPSVIQAATRYLDRVKVDATISSFTHETWIRACEACGYLARKDQRIFSVSPGLQSRIEADGLSMGRVHITLLDGDGPHGY